MSDRSRIVWALVLLMVLVVPLTADAVSEKKTGTSYPDEITLEHEGESYALRATGVALREKTFLKVDVYTIVSYVDAAAEVADGPALAELMSPKRLQMDIRRDFSREKLVNSFSDSIEKNYGDDTAPFAIDMAAFLAYFENDAAEGDELIFDYHPARGLRTILNGEVLGGIDNDAFVEALWTIWFGEKPVNKDMRKALLAGA